jgi:hypothetical protein
MLLPVVMFSYIFCIACDKSVTVEYVMMVFEGLYETDI